MDHVSQAILESAALYSPLDSNLQWIFDNAQLLARDAFLQHLSPDSWRHGRGFTARPSPIDPNSGEVDYWEILCPAIAHKMRVPTDFMTDLVATLPEGTKINIGGFKNV